jgi:hypothetical protein
VNYCDCGDYCAWCRPDLCEPERAEVAGGDRSATREQVAREKEERGE